MSFWLKFKKISDRIFKESEERKDTRPYYVIKHKISALFLSWKDSDGCLPSGYTWTSNLEEALIYGDKQKAEDSIKEYSKQQERDMRPYVIIDFLPFR